MPDMLRLGNGFTLIELIVVIAMIAILTLGLIFTFNPITQFNKARDGQREHDLQQLQAALDTYYNDTHCYPQSLNNLAPSYIQKIPTDPDGTYPYVYQNDATTTCPQWSVLYAALKAPVVPQNPCPLASRTSCLPKDYATSGYNYCVLSGTVDCPFIATTTISTQNGGGGGGGGGGGTPTPTPTPYPITCPGGNYYGCTGGNNSCNSIFPSTQCYGQGGTLQCYCDSSCMVNGVKQCAN